MCRQDADLVVISPIYRSEVGGAGIYYNLLCSALRKRGVLTYVVSDRSSGEHDEFYRGVFPVWAALSRHYLRDRLLYAYQNLTYLRLGKVLSQLRPRNVLIHSSFHNHPGIFSHALDGIRRACPESRLIADVRDKLLPAGRLRVLDKYDAIIACSQNVRDYLVAGGVNQDKVHTIPVIQDKIEIPAATSNSVLERYRLTGRKYIYYLGALKEEKGVDQLLAAYLEHLRADNPGLLLVLVGLLKSQSRPMQHMLEQDGVVHPGNLPRMEALALMKEAAVCVNLSPNESLSRVSLEALALSRPVVLPPNVGEYEQYCPEFVAHESTVAGVAGRIQSLIDNPVTASYPIEHHSTAAVIDAYINLLR